MTSGSTKLAIGCPGVWPDGQLGASNPNGHELGPGAGTGLTGVPGLCEVSGLQARAQDHPEPLLSRWAAAHSLKGWRATSLTGQLQILRPFLAKILAQTRVQKVRSKTMFLGPPPPRGKGNSPAFAAWPDSATCHREDRRVRIESQSRECSERTRKWGKLRGKERTHTIRRENRCGWDNAWNECRWVSIVGTRFETGSPATASLRLGFRRHWSNCGRNLRGAQAHREVALQHLDTLTLWCCFVDKILKCLDHFFLSHWGDDHFPS